MTQQNEPFRVSVYWDKDEDARHVQEVLESVNPGHTHPYQGVTDGWLTTEKLNELQREGLSVILTGQTPPEQTTIDASLSSASSPDLSSSTLTADAIPKGIAVSPEATKKMVPQILRRSKYGDQQLQGQIQELEGSLPDTDVIPYKDMYLVRLKETLHPEWQDELKQYGNLCSYRYPNICQMFITRENVDKVMRLPYVSNVRRYGLTETLTTDLLDVIKEDDSKRSSESELAEAEATPQLMADETESLADTQTFEIILHDPNDFTKITALIDSNPQTNIIGMSDNAIRYQAPVDKKFIAQLGNRLEVKSISVYKPAALCTDRARKLIGVEAINIGTVEAAQQFGRWTGKNVKIGVFDSGIDETHPDFIKDRIELVQFNGIDVTDHVGHGTHVAGIIAGSGKESGADCPLRGIAPEASLVIVGITDSQGRLQLDHVVDLGELLSIATAKGATILNLSWGSAIGGSYDHGSASVDKFIYDNPNVLVIVAVGNSGEEDASGNLRFNTVGTPASAKNVLTVGASSTDRADDVFKKPWGEFRPAKFPKPVVSEQLVSGNPDLPAAISSRGPTDFDSIKPDVLAPGTFILSTRITTKDKPYNFFWKEIDEFNNRYAYLGGSSMAAPMVTGAAAIILQYLREEKNLINPSAALLKAILIAATKRLPSIKSPDLDSVVGYPDFDQGHGRIDISSVLPFTNAPPRRKLLCIDIANGSDDALQSRPPIGAARKASRTYKVRVADNVSGELRIVLAYTDFPGNFVQNNLQLDVKGPDQNHVGNESHRYRKDPIFDDKSDDGIPYDKRNNVEQVRIEKPQAGEYRIRVIAQNTPFPPQGYALCVCGELDSELEVVN
jgi:serine protease AprX